MSSFLKENKLSYQPKVVLVHDDFCQKGGAESLFAEIAQIFPDAPIYTSLVSWSKLPANIDKGRVHTSFLQKIPFAAKFFKILLPLYPLAFESFDFSNFDVVISSTTRFAKGIITKPPAVHICYINSTPRFLWHETSKEHYYPKWLEPFAKPILTWLKRWDMAASSRPDVYLANSQNIRWDIKKIYGREAEVVYPFADTDFFTPSKDYQQSTINNQQSSYYLVVSRLSKWKRVDLAIKACATLGKNLIIVGAGPDQPFLKKLAQSSKLSIFNSQLSTISFLGHVSREKLRELYQNAQALIVTQEEDFGISAVEAQACGIPVIAYNRGGQTETIIEGKTGLFFEDQSKKSLEDAISRASEVKWNLSACRNNSLRFSQANFVKSLKENVSAS